MTSAPWYLNKWRDAVDIALQEHPDTGTALTFVEWMTKLVNGEDTFKTNSKAKSARISSASTGGGGSDYGAFSIEIMMQPLESLCNGGLVELT